MNRNIIHLFFLYNMESNALCFRDMIICHSGMAEAELS